MAWIQLGIAGLLEIVWALGLKHTARLHAGSGRASAPSRPWSRASYFLARALKALPVGTAYAVWTGIGAIGTAMLGIVLSASRRRRGASCRSR